jgi:PTH1 family peptidyl-tRNA hydrolase
MWLVVGLGNPGAKYAKNRHNIGFMVVDELARKHNLPAWKSGVKGGEATTGLITTERGREKAVLLKPLEFMNLSGFAVSRAASFYSVDVDNILVVHDEIDLDFGIVRLKNGGGHGGHNGLRSMMEQLGGGNFARVRMGVGRDPNKPPGSKDAASWVLADFPSAQASTLDRVISAGCEDVEAVLALGILAAMNKHNARSNLATS